MRTCTCCDGGYFFDITNTNKQKKKKKVIIVRSDNLKFFKLENSFLLQRYKDFSSEMSISIK